MNEYSRHTPNHPVDPEFADGLTRSVKNGVVLAIGIYQSETDGHQTVGTALFHKKLLS